MPPASQHEPQRDGDCWRRQRLCLLAFAVRCSIRRACGSACVRQTRQPAKRPGLCMARRRGCGTSRHRQAAYVEARVLGVPVGAPRSGRRSAGSCRSRPRSFAQDRWRRGRSCAPPEYAPRRHLPRTRSRRSAQWWSACACRPFAHSIQSPSRAHVREPPRVSDAARAHCLHAGARARVEPTCRETIVRTFGVPPRCRY